MKKIILKPDSFGTEISSKTIIAAFDFMRDPKSQVLTLPTSVNYEFVDIRYSIKDRLSAYLFGV